MMALVKCVLLPSTMRTTALWGFAVGLVREANSLSHLIKMSSEDHPVLVAFTEIGSKKKCFSNALGYTLVVLEML